MSQLTFLPNIGPELARRLEAVGISTPEQLREAGAELTFLRLKAQDPTACFHMLTAVEGAVRGVKKTQLPPERKEQLRQFFRGIPQSRDLKGGPAAPFQNCE